MCLKATYAASRVGMKPDPNLWVQPNFFSMVLKVGFPTFSSRPPPPAV